MTVALTVATDQPHRLQDARGLLWFDPLTGIPTSTGESLSYFLVAVDPGTQDTEFIWGFRPVWGSVIEVDGIEYRSQMMSGNSFYFFNCRRDHIRECRQDTEGFCDCHPYEYQPLTYRVGEICEACWLGVNGDPYSGGEVVGVGTSSCPHN